MNYIVIGLVLLVGAGWLLIAILGALVTACKEMVDVVAKAGVATATGARVFGSRAYELFRRGVRYLSRNWVSIEIPSDLGQLERQVLDRRQDLEKIQAWKPADIREMPGDFQTFQTFVLPESRGVGSEIHLRDLITVRHLTDPQPSEILKGLATRDCAFSSAKPSLPPRDSKWPQPISPVVLTLPTCKFESLRPDWMRRRVVLWAYSRERAVATATEARIIKLARDVEQLNASIADANLKLANKRAAYDARYEAHKASIEAQYRLAESEFTRACREETEAVRTVIEAYKRGDPDGVLSYFQLGFRLLRLPRWASTSFAFGFDETGRALIIEVELPNLPGVALSKTVTTPSGSASERKPNKRESSEALKTLHPIVLLRIACEAAHHDICQKLDLVAVNGWVSYRSRSTGQPQTAFVASLIGSPAELRGISLPDVDALAAFQHFRGQSAFVVDDVVPMKPDLVLDRNDPRFVAGKEVMEGLEAQMNLATMDWQDFEHLIRELFERLYQGQGVEVKVTQASRDRGVDAVVLDPDPIRGGKVVIQAKRYINTVDVSAVRDLYGTVHNEGASRGILVTTSSFGPDAYQFVQGKPLTLINGSQLLAYLKEAGKAVRIDLEEARRMGHGS